MAFWNRKLTEEVRLVKAELENQKDAFELAKAENEAALRSLSDQVDVLVQIVVSMAAGKNDEAVNTLRNSTALAATLSDRIADAIKAASAA